MSAHRTGLGEMIGAFVALAAIDCSECTGFNSPVTFGVLGAGIDHLHRGRAAPPQRRPHVQLSPLVTSKTQ